VWRPSPGAELYTVGDAQFAQTVIVWRALVVPGKTPITLKQEVAEFPASNNVGSRAFVLDDYDVVLLLRAIIKREGSISAFAKRHGLERSQLNNMLNGKRAVSSPLVKALGLRRVYVPNG
jgi:hypothetical protein